MSVMVAEKRDIIREDALILDREVGETIKLRLIYYPYIFFISVNKRISWKYDI